MTSRFQEYLAARAPANPMAEVALAIAAQGYPVFACNAQKRPLTEHGYKSATRDSATIRAMFANPAAVMIGVPTGVITGLVGVDVDVKENRQGMDWLNANSHRMPQTRTHRTGSGGLHILLRHPGGEVRIKNSASKIAPGIDVRGDGGYLVWSGSPGYSVADDAPVAEIPDWLMPALCPPEPVAPVTPPAQPRVTSPHAGNTPYGQAALDAECDAIRTAPFGQQEHTLNTSCLKIGALVAGGELEEGPALGALLAACRSMPSQRGRVMARDEAHVRRSFADGMRSPRNSETQIPVTPAHPAAAFLAKLQAKAAQEVAKPLPVAPGLLNVTGVLKLFIDECTAAAIRPQPFLALGAAICVVGTVAGRRYRTKTDLRTNIYVAAVAESGAGKDQAPEVARRVLDAAGLGHYLGGETIASGRAVLTAVETHPAKLFQVDEFGLFLSSVTGPKAPAHKAEIWAELMKLYSRAKGVYRGTEYANRKENPRVDVVQPCVGFYGTSTPHTFWAALAGGAMADGSLARFLLFMSPDTRPDRNPNAGVFEPSAALIAGVQAIAGGSGGSGEVGNLGRTFIAPMTATDAPDPYTVPMTPAAEAAHAMGLAAEDAWALKVANTPQASIVNRLGENAAKLALVAAISRNPSSPVIDRPDVDWGWLLAEHCARTLLQDASRYLADSDYERKVNRALDLIRRHGPVSDHQLFDRHGFKLPWRERQELMRDLVGVGLVEAIPSDPGKPGRPSVKYVIAPSAAPQANGEIGLPQENE